MKEASGLYSRDTNQRMIGSCRVLKGYKQMWVASQDQG